MCFTYIDLKENNQILSQENISSYKRVRKLKTFIGEY